MPKKSTRARTAPPVEGQKSPAGLSRAAAAAVVFAVRVAVVTPLTLTEDGTLHVGGSVAPAGEEVTAQLMVSAPVKPPDGVMVMVDVLPVVAPGLTEMAVLVSVKLGVAAATLTVTEVVWVIVP